MTTTIVGPDTKQPGRPRDYTGPVVIRVGTNAAFYIAGPRLADWTQDPDKAHRFESPAAADAWLAANWPHWRGAMHGCRMDYVKPPEPASTLTDA
jgi:hypothetical protein